MNNEPNIQNSDNDLNESTNEISNRSVKIFDSSNSENRSINDSNNNNK
jgi:hypothetical protein